LIKIVLEDNSYLLSDTSLVDISLKLCGDNSCDFKKVFYSNNQIQRSLLSDKVLEIEYLPAGLVPGDYELLINSKDLAGNNSLSPYRIMFKVSDLQNDVTITASPNPSSDYVQFRINGDQNSDFKFIQSSIYDIRGNVIETKILNYGSKSWYWVPQVNPGLYIYKIILKSSTGKQNSITGKLIINK